MKLYTEKHISSSIKSLLIGSWLLLLAVPGNAQSREFLFNNGLNYMMADKNKAIELFSEAIAIDTSFSAAYFYRGMANYKLGQYESAIADFDKVSQLDSTIKIVHMYKGFAFRQLGDDHQSMEAIATYMKSQKELNALEYNVMGKAKMNVGDLDGAINDFEEALAKNNSESEHYHLFLALYKDGKYESAKEQINLAIKENNDFYGYYINRGNTLLNLGAFEEALSDYNYALTLEPGVPDSYYLRGKVLDTLQMHESAILDFTKAIQLNPDDGTYYSKRGNARYAVGNRSGACMDWTIAGNLGYYADFEKIKSLCD